MGGKSIAVGLSRAVRSLQGLALGDAFGQRYFGADGPERIRARVLAPKPWRWTDDTEMAVSLVEELGARGEIDPGSLARRFTSHFHASRGYGGGAQEWMMAVGAGLSWQDAAARLFDGQGSYGNGGAMRVGPLGAYFGGDPATAAAQARLSAQVTHSHSEGQAGAIAVAVAASFVAVRPFPTGKALLEEVLRFVPAGPTRDGITTSLELDPREVVRAAGLLGSGNRVSSQDTVPFALFCAAHHLGSFEEAMWATVSGLGDRDTTCAIVGGLVALTDEPPAAWLSLREPLPDLQG